MISPGVIGSDHFRKMRPAMPSKWTLSYGKHQLWDASDVPSGINHHANGRVSWRMSSWDTHEGRTPKSLVSETYHPGWVSWGHAEQMACAQDVQQHSSQRRPYSSIMESACPFPSSQFIMLRRTYCSCFRKLKDYCYYRMSTSDIFASAKSAFRFREVCILKTDSTILSYSPIKVTVFKAQLFFRMRQKGMSWLTCTWYSFI